MASESASSAHDQLLKKCIGKTVRIPFLYSLSPKWKHRLNGNYSQDVTDHLETWRKSWIGTPREYQRNKEADTSYFSACVWPEAGIEELKALAVWPSFIYFWDDVLDYGELDNKDEEREAFRVQTLTCIHDTLMTEVDSTFDPSSIEPVGRARAPFSWNEIGIQIRKGKQSKSSTKAFFEFMNDYINGAVDLQVAFDKKVVLFVDEYLALRWKTAAVFPAISLIPYACQIQLPDWFFSNAMILDAMQQITIMVGIANDMYSAREELRQGHTDNLIPLLVYHKGIDEKQAMDEASQMVQSAYLKFGQLEPQLLHLGAKQDIQTEMQTFLRCSKDVYIGIVDWVYEIQRFIDYDRSWGNVEVPVVLGQSLKASRDMVSQGTH